MTDEEMLGVVRTMLGPGLPLSRTERLALVTLLNRYEALQKKYERQVELTEIYRDAAAEAWFKPAS